MHTQVYVRKVDSLLFLLQIKLADKQAALEKLEWETMTSNRKVEKLREDLDLMKDETAAFMRVFEESSKCDSTIYAQEKDTDFHPLSQLPQIVSFLLLQ